MQPPYLHVAGGEINLGTVPVGTDRRFELRLENRGMRLLRGSVSCDDDTPWLSLGEGARQKLFQFTSAGTIPVQVVGQRLRAGNKPLEGRLSIESNGGNFVVMVRAIVPIRAYADGPFKGAVTPRQIAEKAKAAPRKRRPISRTAPSPAGIKPTVGLIRFRGRRRPDSERCSNSSRRSA